MKTLNSLQNLLTIISDYEKVIPKTFKQELSFSTEDFIDSLKKSAL